MDDYDLSTNSERRKEQAWEKEFPAIEPFEEVLEQIAGRGSIAEDQDHGYNSQKQSIHFPGENKVFVRYDNTEVQNQTTLGGIEDIHYRPEHAGKAI